MQKTDFFDILIRPSRSFAALLVTVHALTVFAMLALPLALWVRVAACIVLLANMVPMVRKHALINSARACVRLRINAHGECELQLRNGDLMHGRLRAGWLASPLLIAIQIRLSDRSLPRNIALLPDSSDRETLRRLRIFLRFGVSLVARHE